MNEVSIDLYEPSNNKIRYTIHILDQKPNRENGRYAAFIVPQGRETEWLFSTEPGRKKLLQSAKHDRLAIVSMHRGHEYKSWDDVKDELSGSIRNFAPNGLKNQQVTFINLNSIYEVRIYVSVFDSRFHFCHLALMLAYVKPFSKERVISLAIILWKKSKARTIKYFDD